jgi:hypothetical protein
VLCLYIIAIHAPCTILLVNKAGCNQRGSEQWPIWIIQHMARILDKGLKHDQSFKPYLCTTKSGCTKKFHLCTKKHIWFPIWKPSFPRDGFIPSSPLKTVRQRTPDVLIQQTCTTKSTRRPSQQRVVDTHFPFFFHFDQFWQITTHLQRSSSNLGIHTRYTAQIYNWVA